MDKASDRRQYLKATVKGPTKVGGIIIPDGSIMTLINEENRSNNNLVTFTLPNSTALFLNQAFSQQKIALEPAKLLLKRK